MHPCHEKSRIHFFSIQNFRSRKCFKKQKYLTTCFRCSPSGVAISTRSVFLVGAIHHVSSTAFTSVVSAVGSCVQLASRSLAREKVTETSPAAPTRVEKSIKWPALAGPDKTSSAARSTPCGTDSSVVVQNKNSAPRSLPIISSAEQAQLASGALQVF